MRDASPAFQPDKPGSPGFQLAEAHGFDTQTPVVLGALGAVVGVDAVVTFADAAPYHDVLGDVGVVVGVDAVVTFTPRPATVPGGTWIVPRRWAVTGAVGAVVAVDARVRFTTALERDDAEVLELLLLGGRALSLEAYVRADDEEVLALLLRAARASGT